MVVFVWKNGHHCDFICILQSLTTRKKQIDKRIIHKFRLICIVKEINMKSLRDKNNPILFENINTDYLDEAKSTLADILEEYLQNNPDKSNEISALKKELELAYLKRKSQFFVQNRTSYLSEYLSTALSFALKRRNDKGVESSKLYYLKQSKRFTLNEQF